jgi:hypothetical protein
MNPEPPLMAVEKLSGAGGEWRPIAVENVSVNEALQFQVTLLFEKPVAMDFEFVKGHGSAKNGQGSHRYSDW